MIEIDLLVRFIHVLGAIVAVGGVLSTDLINSYKFFHPEKFNCDIRVEKIFSLMIWTGLFTLAVTGSLMFMGYPAAVEGTMFQLKMFFVAVLFLNGAFLNNRVEPRFEKINEDDDRELRDERKFELIAGASAVISVISWLAALMIGYF
jgi:uncharacterized membrane protein